MNELLIQPSLGQRIIALWRLKLLMLAVLPIPFVLGYSAMQWLTPFEPTVVYYTAIDQAISFNATWVWAYASLYVFMPIAPALATRRESLLRYTCGGIVMAIVSFSIFYFFPTIAPRTHLDAGPQTNALYDWIISVDEPLNACPSLHAGLTLYTLMMAFQVLHGTLPRHQYWLITGMGTIWAVAILYSTIAIRQHVVLDLITGGTLGLICHVLVWKLIPLRACRFVDDPPLASSQQEHHQ